MITLPSVPLWLIPKPRDAVVALMVASLCLPLGYCKGESAGKAREIAAAAVATVEVMRTDGSAKEVATVERVNDLADVAATKEALTDAVASLPDSTPSVRRVALGCERLRRQDIDTTNLPACSGLIGSAKAATVAR